MRAGKRFPARMLRSSGVHTYLFWVASTAKVQVKKVVEVLLCMCYYNYRP